MKKKLIILMFIAIVIIIINIIISCNPTFKVLSNKKSSTINELDVPDIVRATAVSDIYEPDNYINTGYPKELQLGEVQDRSLLPSDTDYCLIYTVPGKSYTIKTTEVVTEGYVIDTDLALLEYNDIAQYVYLMEDNAVGMPSIITWTATDTAYFVRIRDHTSPSGNGYYTISFTQN
ncbi:MAG: hypothetical protein JXB50_14465 [Spirochaetes bacterium]|nr:hypothetical protein [Spirochaetota bacterium]